MIQSKEEDVNEYIDNYCIEIDKRCSSKNKSQIIKENLQNAQKCVDKINLFMQMEPAEKRYIYDESFLTPWNQFYKIVDKIFKNTSFLNIVSNKQYIQFQKHFYANKDILKYGDFDECLHIQDISPCIDEYIQFYQYVKNILTKMKDVSCYEDEIEKCAEELTKNLESKLPKNSAEEYLKVKQEWLLIYEKIFKYKLQVALSNDGVFPSILEFIENPEILMEAVDQAEKLEESKELAMSKELEFLTSVLNEPTNNEELDEELRQIKECIE